jgi:hypothetical protein
MNWKSGLYLRRELWDLAEQTLKSDMFPKFKCNLFIQHKRPEYVSSPRGNEYPHWKQPYLRFEVNNNQQSILDKLEKKTSPHAIVVYACPSFWKLKDLWRFIRGHLVENSNFTKPSKLQGHKKYTFIQGGSEGYACSEPEPVERIDLLKEVGRMLKESIVFKDNIEFLKRLAIDIKTVINEIDEETRKGFFAIHENLGYPEQELGRAITLSQHSTCSPILLGESLSRAHRLQLTHPKRLTGE